jgi:hypothetical protein
MAPFAALDLIYRALFLALWIVSCADAAPNDSKLLWVEPVTTYQLTVGPRSVGGYYRSAEEAWRAYTEWQDSENDLHPRVQIIVGNFRPCPFGWQSRDSWNGQSGSYCHDYRRMEDGQVSEEGTSSMVARGYVCPTDALLKVSRTAPMTLNVACQLRNVAERPHPGCCSDTARLKPPLSDNQHPANSCYPSRYSYWDSNQGRNVTQSFCFAYRAAPRAPETK